MLAFVSITIFLKFDQNIKISVQCVKIVHILKKGQVEKNGCANISEDSAMFPHFTAFKIWFLLPQKSIF